MVGEFAFQAILMHYPVALLSLRSSPPVKNQRLFHPDKRTSLGAENLSILPRRLPVSSFRGPVRPETGGVLPVTEAEEVPFLLAHLCLFCSYNEKKKKDEINLAEWGN